MEPFAKSYHLSWWVEPRSSCPCPRTPWVRPLEAGLGLQAIADRMGLSYSGISRRVSAVRVRLATDLRFRRRVESALDVKVKT